MAHVRGLFAAPWKKAPPLEPAAPQPGDPQLARLLTESVVAILRPHLEAALPAYAAKDRLAVIVAYGVGCMIVADLLSQNVSMSGWDRAGVDAIRKLFELCAGEEEQGVDAAALVRAAESWRRRFEWTDAFADACRAFEGAINEIKNKRMSAKGSILIRAAMARLEAITFDAHGLRGLAA